jgi:hypothetical protein
MPQSWDMGQIFNLPSEGRHAEDFYIQRLRPGLNPRTREPEASMRTTRATKPSVVNYLVSKLVVYLFDFSLRYLCSIGL